MKNYKNREHKRAFMNGNKKGDISMEMIIAISLVALLFIVIGYIFATKLTALGGP